MSYEIIRRTGSRVTVVRTYETYDEMVEAIKPGQSVRMSKEEK